MWFFLGGILESLIRKQVRTKKEDLSSECTWPLAQRPRKDYSSSPDLSFRAAQQSGSKRLFVTAY